MGKTSLALGVTRRLNRLVIIDTLHDPTLTDAGVMIESELEAIDYVEKNEFFRVVYRPFAEEDEGCDFLFPALIAKGDLVVLIDELSEWTSPHSIRKPLNRLIRQGRHRGVKVVAATHRPADVHKLFVSQADLVLGRITEPNDLRYLSSYVTDPEQLKTLSLPVVNKQAKTLTLEFVWPSRYSGPVRVTVPLPEHGRPR